MLNPHIARKLTFVLLIVQPVIFLLTIFIGSLNSDNNGFNGMQAVFVVPIFLVILATYQLWKYLTAKSTGNKTSMMFINGILVAVYVLAIIVDLGIVASAFMSESHINLFSFPPTITKN